MEHKKYQMQKADAKIANANVSLKLRRNSISIFHYENVKHKSQFRGIVSKITTLS